MAGTYRICVGSCCNGKVSGLSGDCTCQSRASGCCCYPDSICLFVNNIGTKMDPANDRLQYGRVLYKPVTCTKTVNQCSGGSISFSGQTMPEKEKWVYNPGYTATDIANAQKQFDTYNDHDYYYFARWSFIWDSGFIRPGFKTPERYQACLITYAEVKCVFTPWNEADCAPFSGPSPDWQYEVLVTYYSFVSKAYGGFYYRVTHSCENRSTTDFVDNRIQRVTKLCDPFYLNYLRHQYVNDTGVTPISKNYLFTDSFFVMEGVCPSGPEWSGPYNPQVFYWEVCDLIKTAGNWACMADFQEPTEFGNAGTSWDTYWQCLNAILFLTPCGGSGSGESGSGSGGSFIASGSGIE